MIWRVPPLQGCIVLDGVSLSNSCCLFSAMRTLSFGKTPFLRRYHGGDAFYQIQTILLWKKCPAQFYVAFSEIMQPLSYDEILFNLIKVSSGIMNRGAHRVIRAITQIFLQFSCIAFPYTGFWIQCMEKVYLPISHQRGYIYIWQVQYSSFFYQVWGASLIDPINIIDFYLWKINIGRFFGHRKLKHSAWLRSRWMPSINDMRTLPLQFKKRSKYHFWQKWKHR